jgi:hypothetical protein
LYNWKVLVRLKRPKADGLTNEARVVKGRYDERHVKVLLGADRINGVEQSGLERWSRLLQRSRDEMGQMLRCETRR